MGLAIEVGYLADMLENDEEGAEWFSEELAKLEQFLPTQGLRAHSEPKKCPVFSVEMHGYSGLHYLRRFAAHLNLTGSRPEPGDQDASKDPVLERYYSLLNAPARSVIGRMFGRKTVSRRYDHLIYHSDAEGYYIPQDFPDVLFPPESLAIPGGMIGSSHRLLAEIEHLATALELPLTLDPEDEEVWNAADAQGESETLWKRYGVESFTCVRLYQAAKHSIEHSAAIVFC